MEWVIKGKTKKQKFTEQQILDILLENRNLKTKREKDLFLNPANPLDISLEEIGIDKKEFNKALSRLKKAKKNKEEIIVYGDYDADGICATAILWEALFKFKYNILPFIPNRFEDGYGITAQSIDNLKNKYKNLKVIITVDNGIVAHEAHQHAAEMGIDIIVTDHHAKDDKKNKAFAIIHTTQTSGSGVAWFFAKEICGKEQVESSLELACIGTVADQLPLIGVNRSIVLHGLKSLQKTRRKGLVHVIAGAGVEKEKIGQYEIGFVIAPRINAMGRLGDGTDALRLICTTNSQRAAELANLVNLTNSKRQKILEEVVIHSQEVALVDQKKGVMLLIHESYHEGIIGLAASRLVEQFGRPAIVVAKGEKISKGSARSVTGVNITDLLRQMEELLLSIGGHEMAAGFSIDNNNLDKFSEKLELISAPEIQNLPKDKKLNIDLEIGFENVDWDLAQKLDQFEPTGNGNPKPLFATSVADVVEKKLLGSEKQHLKLKIKHGERVLDAIGFRMGENFEKLDKKVSLAYNIEINSWNGVESLQLKVKDIHIGEKF
jgi:single-stranded-DNA-specific exonuclease